MACLFWAPLGQRILEILQCQDAEISRHVCRRLGQALKDSV
jgi:hypothetical protein